MKQIIMAILMLLIPVTIYSANDFPKMTFCENFDDSWNPIKEGNEFSEKSVSWIARIGKPFGVQQICVTIYKHDGISQKLLHRENIDINPSWDTFAVRNMDLPSEGEYTIALTNLNGDDITSGRVYIIKSESIEKPKKKEIKGGILEELFNRYAPKK